MGFYQQTKINATCLITWDKLKKNLIYKKLLSLCNYSVKNVYLCSVV